MSLFCILFIVSTCPCKTNFDDIILKCFFQRSSSVLINSYAVIPSHTKGLVSQLSVVRNIQLLYYTNGCAQSPKLPAVKLDHEQGVRSINSVQVIGGLLRLFLLSLIVFVRIVALPVFHVHKLILIFLKYSATIQSLYFTKIVVYNFKIF